MLRAGRSLTDSSNVNLPGGGGIVELYDWEGNLIWSWFDDDQNSRQHHDVFPMPNGNILVLSATIIGEADAIAAGRDPNLIDSSGELYNERIYEVEPTGTNGGNIVWEWNIKDHLIQDFDITKHNFGVVSENPGKGNLLTQSTYQLLEDNDDINFVGNVEGRDLFNDKADVIVCDGFTGNVVLKLAESFYSLINQKNIKDDYFDRFNYEIYGGTPVLGVDGNVLIGHGISNENAIKNMILLGKDLINSNLNSKIKKAFR